MSRIGPRTAAKLGAVAVVSTLLLAGCSASGNSNAPSADKPVTQAQIDKAMNTPTTITFWSWLPGVEDNQVKAFEKKYPKITVKYSNAGQGTPEYTKLRTVIKAGSGQPDVAQVEYQYIPTFESDLLDLTPYGGDKLSSQFVPSVWDQVSSDGAVYGIPQDTGPMGNLYRPDLLAAAGITTPPATWTDYMADAKALKDKTGNYISDLPGNDAGQFIGLMWQGGAKPFAYDGKKTVTVNLESAASKKVIDYWNTMIQQGLVDTAPDFNNDWFQSFASGKYAGWLGAAWSPDQLSGSVAKTSGKWAASALPQWDAANPTSGFWGGSSDAVLKSSKNPIVAYEFAKYINTDPGVTIEASTGSQSLYPSTVATLNNPKFSEQKTDFFGGQQVNKLFGEISKTIDPKFGWLPYMDYVYTTYNTTLGKAIADKTDLEAGLKAWQDQVVAYGKQQGFTVKTS